MLTDDEKDDLLNVLSEPSHKRADFLVQTVEDLLLSHTADAWTEGYLKASEYYDKYIFNPDNWGEARHAD